MSMSRPVFKFNNKLPRKGYNTYDNTFLRVQSVDFDVSIHGEAVRRITFDTWVTIDFAIKTVEKFLAGPISKELFSEERYSVFDGFETYEEAIDYFKSIGDLLGDVIDIVELKVDENGIMEIITE